MTDQDFKETLEALAESVPLFLDGSRGALLGYDVRHL
jgi:hypothetical protein